MYERSAIVLERYFENLFGFNKTSNLAQNYKNYCELFEKFNNFQIANNDEFQALEDFKAAEATIEEIQTQQEKLYKKNAKLEYSRDLIFNDITQKPEEIEKCMAKIEGDIAKVQNTLVNLREKFVEAIQTYNQRKSALSKCKKVRKNAEAEYSAIFEVTKQNIENIPEDYITLAKAFSEDVDQEELINIMLDNGKDEKIPFNNAVIRSAVKVSFDIQTRMIDSYLDAYNKTNKLISELLEGAVSVELHQKTIRNTNVRFNFLNAEKDYIVQFLDYERIMVIHGKRTHRNLMLEACENFAVDVDQINNLYTLLQKEISNKSTKKAYKELYNKSYLIGIEENDEKFRKEKTKINLSTATVMNTNYWRLEGIKNIYTVFYRDVVEVFGKDLDEFEIPKDPEEMEEALCENAGQELEGTVQTIEEIFEPAEEIAPEPEVELEPEIIIEQVADDIPALPGMAEAIKENKKNETKAKEKEKVVEEAAEEEKTEKKNSKTKAKKVKRYTRKKEKKPSVVLAQVQEPEAEIEVNAEPQMDVVEPQIPVKDDEELDLVDILEDSFGPEIEVDIDGLDDFDEDDVDDAEETEDEDEEEEVLVAKKLEPAEYNDVFDEIEEEPDIFGEKYRDIESKIAELDDLDNITLDEEKAPKEKVKVEAFDVLAEAKEVVNDIQENEDKDDTDDEEDEDIPYEYEDEEDIPYEDEELAEDSIFENIENDEYEELSLKKASKASTKKTKKAKSTKTKKSGILKNIMKLNNAKDNKKVAEN